MYNNVVMRYGTITFRSDEESCLFLLIIFIEACHVSLNLFPMDLDKKKTICLIKKSW